ncbi:hypothetical protein ISN45_Aa05g010760 [Arabidopsis thaliana x Arabidopsis arenosa]|uniref:Uncharacterized protein n=1 Tax=Arabidopsis thaliana x Arabidopsis arenosa TaxID=1240361 RepID=A0A8T1ZJD4_9BRAS|nr:hypothetical protein ISN45_Aa05g010760 [Arabidopsis thaliana x Arabidopsis arenosa]KAG7559484.1 hypothetical protein ISN45_Aa05g010760 [Arabidopsis thaliana x Arabidopsis arenosa]
MSLQFKEKEVLSSDPEKREIMASMERSHSKKGMVDMIHLIFSHPSLVETRLEVVGAGQGGRGVVKMFVIP